MIRELIFWGGTGQAKVLHEAIDHKIYRLMAIVDNRVLTATPVTGVITLHGKHELLKWLEHRSHHGFALPCFAVPIGGSKGRDRLMLISELKALGMEPLSVIHRRAFVANDAEIGNSAQILAMSAVCSNAKIGDGVIVNTSAVVEHDCVVHDGAHIGPGATLAGEVIIGKYSFIGTGAVILPRVHVGEGAIVGAGSVVTQDVVANSVVTGNPARILNKNAQQDAYQTNSKIP